MGFSSWIQGIFSFLHSNQRNDIYNQYSSAQLKALLDSQTDELKTNHNGLISALQSKNAGDSGAKNIGVSPISGLTGDDIQTILEAIASLGAGSLPPDGAISNAKLATDNKVGSLASLNTTDKISVTNAINEIFQYALQQVMTTKGDIVYRNATVPVRLGIGADKQVLGINMDVPIWQDSLQSLMTAKGDIVYATASNTPSRLAIGSAWKVLGVNSTADDLLYLESLQSLITAKGDLICGGGPNTPQRVAIGGAGSILYVSSDGLPTYLSLSGDSTKILGISGGLPAWVDANKIATADSNTLLSATTLRQTQSNTYVTLKSFRMRSAGTYNIYYTLNSSNGSNQVKLGLSINGSTAVDIATTTYTTSGVYTTTSILAGSLIELKCIGVPGSSYARLSNVTIGATLSTLTESVVKDADA